MELKNYEKAKKIRYKIEELNLCLGKLNMSRQSSEDIAIALDHSVRVIGDNKLLPKIYDILHNEIQSKVTELEKEFMNL